MKLIVSWTVVVWSPPCGLAGRRFTLMHEVVGSNTTEGKICFSHFTLIRVKCEKLFCKTNIKVLKLILK